MNVKAIIDALVRLDDDGSLNCGRTAGDALDWLGQLDIPPALREAFATGWPRAERSFLRMGEFDLWPVRRIQMDPDTPALLPVGLLPIGHSSFFDILTIDFASPGEVEVGLISHDLLWETETAPRDCYRRICRSLEVFLRRLAAGKMFPHDYFRVPIRKPNPHPAGRGNGVK